MRFVNQSHSLLARLCLLFLRAAALVGSTMSDFVIRASLESAEQVLKNHSSITLQNRYFDSFITARENPPEPNQALKGDCCINCEA